MALYHLEDKRALVLPIRCNSYFCSKCNKRLKAITQDKVLKWSCNRKLYFYTLTTWTKKHSRKSSYLNINKSFGKLIQFIRRNYSTTFQFFKVLEFTKKGYAHLHFITDINIKEDIISKQWLTYYKSYIVKKVECYNINFLRLYLTKYLTKSSDDYNLNLFYFTTRKRRFSYSRTFDYIKELKLKWNYYDTDSCIPELLNLLRIKLCLELFNNEWNLTIVDTS